MHAPRVAEKNTPYWWEAAPVLPLAKKLDVAIVGAGYAGLSAGLVLAREGRSVAAFDAMNPGEGASSRNGGIISGSIRPDYATIARRFGEDKAGAIEVEGKLAREFLYEFIETERLDCDFQLVGRFTGALGYDQYEKEKPHEHTDRPHRRGTAQGRSRMAQAELESRRRADDGRPA